MVPDSSMTFCQGATGWMPFDKVPVGLPNDVVMPTLRVDTIVNDDRANSSTAMAPEMAAVRVPPLARPWPVARRYTPTNTESVATTAMKHAREKRKGT